MEASGKNTTGLFLFPKIQTDITQKRCHKAGRAGGNATRALPDSEDIRRSSPSPTWIDLVSLGFTRPNVKFPGFLTMPPREEIWSNGR